MIIFSYTVNNRCGIIKAITSEAGERGPPMLGMCLWSEFDLLQLYRCLSVPHHHHFSPHLKHQWSSAVITSQQHKCSVNRQTHLTSRVVGVHLINLSRSLSFIMRSKLQLAQNWHLHPDVLGCSVALCNRCCGERPWLAHMLIPSLNKVTQLTKWPSNEGIVLHIEALFSEEDLHSNGVMNSRLTTEWW